MLRSVTAMRYVGPLREGGSLPGLIEADDDGLYVVKFRAAGQGAKALVAEVIVGEIGRTLGLPVPELVLVEVPPPLGRTEPDPEINELVSRSAGINVGLDFLPGALDLNAARLELIDAELAAQIVWFDALATNVDRTPRNPNLLVWHARPWLIDHGAALYQHHGEVDLPARAGDRFALIRQHVLLPRAGDLLAADATLAPRLDTETLEQIIALVPDALLGTEPTAERQSYLTYLTRRLAPPRAFAAEVRAAQEDLRGS